MRRLVAMLLLAGALVWLTGAPAAAHASLISSDPADGSVVAAVPDQLVLTFNEPVRLDDGAISGFTADGTDWALDAEAQDNRVVVTPAADPGQGTVVVAWRVTSEDGHVVSGAVTFSIGTPTQAAAAAEPQTQVTALRWATSGVAGLALLGSLALALAGRRADPVWLVGFGAALLLAPLHELADAGRGLGGLTDWLAWLDGLTRPVSLLLLAAYAVAAAARSVSRRVLAVALTVPAVVLAGGAAYSALPERAGPQTVTAALGDAGTVRLSVEQRSAGTIILTATILDRNDGPLQSLQPATIAVDNDRISLGSVDLTEIGPSAYRGELVVPTDGTWQAQVSVRLSEFDNPVAVLEFDVGGSAPTGPHQPRGEHG